MPLVKLLGIDPIHFGIVMTVNLAIGMFTPPFGLNMFVAQSVLGIPLHRVDEGEHIGAFGAARLARIAFTGESVANVCTPRSRVDTILPDPAVADAYSAVFGRYRRLAAAIRDAMGIAATENPRS